MIPVFKVELPRRKKEFIVAVDAWQMRFQIRSERLEICWFTTASEYQFNEVDIVRQVRQFRKNRSSAEIALEKEDHNILITLEPVGLSRSIAKLSVEDMGQVIDIHLKDNELEKLASVLEGFFVHR